MDKSLRIIKFIEIDGKKIPACNTYLYAMPNDEIDERIRQLKYETVKNSLFITAEQICFDFFNAVKIDAAAGNHDEEEKLINKFLSYDELIVKYAQSFENRKSSIEFFKTVLVEREKLQRPTAIFSNMEMSNYYSKEECFV